ERPQDIDRALVHQRHRGEEAGGQYRAQWTAPLRHWGMARLSVVAPVFREAKVLPELYRRLCAAITPLTSDFEILLVADGGNDGSWRVIKDLSAADPRVKGIKFTRNFGQHLAISAGLDACDGDFVVVMDSDLQDRPEVIPQLFAKAHEGYDVVF